MTTNLNFLLLSRSDYYSIEIISVINQIFIKIIKLPKKQEFFE